MTSPAIDPGRLAVQVRRALDEALMPAEFIDADKLDVTAYPNVVRVLFDNVEVGRFDRPLVESFDPDRLRPFVACAIFDRFPTWQADQLIAGVNDGRMRIIAPADSDYVRVDIDGVKVAAVHRHCLIDGFPERNEQ